MAQFLVAALTWDPQVKGGVIVLLATLILPGSAYLLLSTNLGARLGFLIAAAGLMGWMAVMGVVWTVYGIGLKGTSPEWKIVRTVQGDIGSAGEPALAGFPSGWKQIALEDPKVAEGQAVADTALAPPSDSGRKGIYASSSDYVAVGGYDKGGQTYFFTLKHRAHYLLMEVQGVIAQQTVPGQPPPRPQADPSKPVAYVLMLRNLGNLRQKPGQFALICLVLFVLLVYVLHTRDKRVMAARAAKTDG